MGTISIELLQQCKLKNKYLFADLVKGLNQEQFERFCKEIMHLRQRYDLTTGAYCTDQPAVYHLNEEYMWKLEPIDFDQEIHFEIGSD